MSTAVPSGSSLLNLFCLQLRRTLCVPWDCINRVMHIQSSGQVTSVEFFARGIWYAAIATCVTLHQLHTTPDPNDGDRYGIWQGRISAVLQTVGERLASVDMCPAQRTSCWPT